MQDLLKSFAGELQIPIRRLLRLLDEGMENDDALSAHEAVHGARECGMRKCGSCAMSGSTVMKAVGLRVSVTPHAA
jgi:hypothetical protein